MEEKRVCSYCGTIFDSALEKCPLCGSRSSTPQETQPEQERPRPQHTGGGKFAAPRRRGKKKSRASDSGAGSGNRLLLAAVIILAIAVLLVLYFIGDMIGWWPGFEDLVQRETQSQADRSEEAGTCTTLELSTNSLSFTQAGESLELTISVNLDCAQSLSIVPTRSGLVRIVPKTDKPVEGVELKSMTYLLTAAAEGSTELTVLCGDQEAVCTIDCAFVSGSEQTQPSTDTTEPSDSDESSQSSDSDSDFEPELNYADVSLFASGESFQLKVTNLPSGAKVRWSSGDETIAMVDENGKVTAVGGGTTYITAEVDGNQARMVVRCNFKTSEPSTGGSYSLNYTDVTIGVGETFYLRLYDSNDTRITEGLSFRVKDSSVATLKENGVTGVSSGMTTVIVTYNGEEYTCIVRVRG